MDSGKKSELGIEVATGQKKAYRSPVLHVYGDVRSMTKSNNVGGTADGMSGSGMTKSFP